MVDPSNNPRPTAVLVAVAVSALLAMATLVLVALEPGATLSWFLYMLISASPIIVGTLGAFYGRNWGRVLLLVLTVASVLLLLFPGFKLMSLNGLVLAINVMVVILLFMPSSSAWFRAKRAEWFDA